MLKGFDITKAVTSMIDILTRMSATMREGMSPLGDRVGISVIVNVSGEGEGEGER